MFFLYLDVSLSSNTVHCLLPHCHQCVHIYIFFFLLLCHLCFVILTDALIPVFIFIFSCVVVIVCNDSLLQHPQFMYFVSLHIIIIITVIVVIF